MPAQISPGFLVAAPSLLDPNFRRSVVLLIEHGTEGSLGFVVNRESTLSFQGVVDELGIGAEDKPAPETPVLTGGPVAPHMGWIVFDPRGEPVDEDGTKTVTRGLAISLSRDLLRAIAHGRGPDRSMLVLGYAGWGAGQLDQELQQGVWLPVSLDEKIVFDTPMGERWEAALRTIGIDPARIVMTPTSVA